MVEMSRKKHILLWLCRHQIAVLRTFCCENDLHTFLSRKKLHTSSGKFFARWNCHSESSDFLGLWKGYGRVVEVLTRSRWRYKFVLQQMPSTNHTVVSFLIRAPLVTTAYIALAPLPTHKHFFYTASLSRHNDNHNYKNNYNWWWWQSTNDGATLSKCVAPDDDRGIIIVRLRFPRAPILTLSLSTARHQIANRNWYT